MRVFSRQIAVKPRESNVIGAGDAAAACSCEFVEECKCHIERHSLCNMALLSCRGDGSRSISSNDAILPMNGMGEDAFRKVRRSCEGTVCSEIATQLWRVARSDAKKKCSRPPGQSRIACCSGTSLNSSLSLNRGSHVGGRAVESPAAYEDRSFLRERKVRLR